MLSALGGLIGTVDTASDLVHQDDAETEGTQIRASCGRIAKIGDLYDARTEEFIDGYNIFQENVDRFIDSQKAEKYHSEFVYTNTVSEKFVNLDIHGELKISMLAGLFATSGSTKFIHEKIKSEESVEYSYILNVRTVKESINMNNKNLRDLVKRDLNNYGTHVVVGVIYGANAIATINYDNYKKHDKDKIESQMKGVIAKFQDIGAEGGGGVDSGAGDDELINKIESKIHSDILPPAIETTGTKQTNAMKFQDVIKRMSSLEKAMFADGFKGKIMEYHLMPMSCVKRIFGLENPTIHFYLPINSSRIKLVEQLFDDVYEKKAMLQSLMLLKNEAIVSTNDKKTINDYSKKVEIAEEKMREELKSVMKKVRSGDSNVNEIEQFVSKFEKESEASPSKIYAFVESYKTLKEKISFVKQRFNDNVLITTEENQLRNIKINDIKIPKYMLFFSYFKDCENANFVATFAYFGKLIKNKQKEIHVLAFIDTDILPGITKKEKLENFCIALFKNTKYECENCLHAPSSQRLLSFVEICSMKHSLK